ncbi:MULTISPECIES: 50S ribosomal protein L25/general stress protein Ctc [Bacillaceae]|uniref:Large ribosomal subunit protein bL25 n=1 Tax=Evansella alkalicola TaxID=745819 RepID=A0ABS6JWD8_9BACI|nr:MULTISPECIES: 50S ribosomal protein L25/general stress protein Ctc [Bacillaceae]MBU9721994.1 50S ribosomal protein L25/general stress protein Ctc [Bacillus alkalicola]
MAAVLEARIREDLRGSRLNKIRNEGRVPGVVYGKTFGNKPVSVEEVELIKTLRNHGKTGVFKLALDGQQTNVMIYEMQQHPLKNEIVHVDFCAIDMKSELDADVPIQIVGEAVGVKNGGVLQQIAHEVSVKALPGNIPESFEVDVSDLDVNDNLQIKDLNTGSDFTINNDPEETIVSILPPTEQENEPEVGDEPEGKEPEAVAEESAGDEEE